MAYKEFIREKGVEGYATVLEVNPSSEDYHVLLDAAGMMLKYKDNFSVESSFQEIAGKAFRGLMLPYLTQIGLDKPEESYVSAGPLRASMDFPGKKIIPWREDILDGYRAEIDFKIEPSKKTNPRLFATGCLESSGLVSELKVLEEIMMRSSSFGNGVDKPKIKRDAKEERIYVAPIKFIPQVLESLKMAYKKVGNKNLEELADLAREIFSIRDNVTAIKILTEDYNRRIKLFSAC